MTDDEALAILSEREDRDLYIAMADDENGVEKPYFRKGSIVLRGDFFPEELLAILHFAPKEQGMTRERVEAILAKLRRWDQYPDFEGSYSMGPCENGEPRRVRQV